MKIKNGLKFVNKLNGVTGRIGDIFECRDRWDSPSDPEWYVHYNGFVLKILSESFMNANFAFELV